MRTVGIDVAKADLVVATYPDKDTSRYPNTDAGRGELIPWLMQHGPDLIVVEATGGYEFPIVVASAAAGLPIRMAPPRQVKTFIYGIGQRAKTDPIDAAAIARFAALADLDLRTIPDETTITLKALVTRRTQLIALKVAEGNRKEIAVPVICQSVDVILIAVTAELAAIEAAIARLIATNPIFTANANLLISVPGIGPVTIRALLAGLPELGHLDRGEIAALVGLAPFDRASGKRQRPGFVIGGRARVRTALYMATLSAIRCNPVIQAMYLRLKDNHKPFKVAMIACERKLLTILNAMLRDREPWNPAPTA